MKKVILLSLIYVLSVGIMTASAWQFNPLEKLQNLADKVDMGLKTAVQGVKDTINPLAKGIQKVDEKLFSGVRQGMFKIQNSIFTGLSEVVGIPVNLKDIGFYLVTADAPFPRKINFYKPIEVANTTSKIFIIIHGWMSSRVNTWFNPLTEVLINKYPGSNVVQVDWHKPAGDNYAFAAFNTESVGDLVGQFITRLIIRYGIPTKNIILIGHSLGGQISGWAGRKFKELTGASLSTIVALDPAGPLFILRPFNKRLNKEDADNVVVIHSNGGKLGFLLPCGTLDFFPNGGTFQPGCLRVDIRDVKTLMNPLSCDHSRSYEYLIEALNTTGSFKARKCKTFTGFLLHKYCEPVEVSMGDWQNQERGVFFLETAPVKPFSVELKPLQQIQKAIEKIGDIAENIEEDLRDSKFLVTDENGNVIGYVDTNEG